MLKALRQLRDKKIPMLVLALLLCVQSFSSLSHSVTMAMQNHAMQMQAEAASDAIPPCHEQAAKKNTQAPPSDCCSDGKCNNNECMVPAGMYFEVSQLDYFVPHRNDVFVTKSYRAVSIAASPPIRPPIA
jgi:hypothetical protein